jgi:hypothetical protein
MIHSSGIDASTASRFAALIISHDGFDSILGALKSVFINQSKKNISFSRGLSVQRDYELCVVALSRREGWKGEKSIKEQLQYEGCTYRQDQPFLMPHCSYDVNKVLSM